MRTDQREFALIVFWAIIFGLSAGFIVGLMEIDEYSGPGFLGFICGLALGGALDMMVLHWVKRKKARECLNMTLDDPTLAFADYIFDKED